MLIHTYPRDHKYEYDLKNKSNLDKSIGNESLLKNINDDRAAPSTLISQIEKGSIGIINSDKG